MRIPKEKEEHELPPSIVTALRESRLATRSKSVNQLIFRTDAREEGATDGDDAAERNDSFVSGDPWDRFRRAGPNGSSIFSPTTSGSHAASRRNRGLIVRFRDATMQRESLFEVGNQITIRPMLAERRLLERIRNHERPCAIDQLDTDRVTNCYSNYTNGEPVSSRSFLRLVYGRRFVSESPFDSVRS